MNEDELQRLMNFQMPIEQSFQAQPLQIAQGLLGSTDTGQQDNGQQHRQDLNDIIGNTTQAASKMAQIAQPIQDPIQNIRTAQSGTQAALQQRQQQAQTGALLGKIASFFIPGGSILGYLK